MSEVQRKFLTVIGPYLVYWSIAKRYFNKSLHNLQFNMVCLVATSSYSPIGTIYSTIYLMA